VLRRIGILVFQLDDAPQLLAAARSVAGLQRGQLEQAVRQGASLGRAAQGGPARAARSLLQPQLVEKLVPPRARARVGELSDGRAHRPGRLLSGLALDARDQLARAPQGGARIRTGERWKRGPRDSAGELRI